MKKTIVYVSALMFCAATSSFAQGKNADEIAIREIIDQFTPMWTTPNGAEIFKKIASDTNYQFISNNTILNKGGFLQLLSKMLQDNPPVKHTHTTRKITVSEALAFEYGTMELVRKNGQTARSESFNVFFREATGWKLIMNLPAADLKKVFAE